MVTETMDSHLPELMSLFIQESNSTLFSSYDYIYPVDQYDKFTINFKRIPTNIKFGDAGQNRIIYTYQTIITN